MFNTIIWLLLTCFLCIGHLAMALQTDWLVHGSIHQGLYALCYYKKCQWRQFKAFSTSCVFTAFLAGNLALWLSIFIAIIALAFVRKNSWKWIYTAANFQFFSGYFFFSKNLNLGFKLFFAYMLKRKIWEFF